MTVWVVTQGNAAEWTDVSHHCTHWGAQRAALNLMRVGYENYFGPNESWKPHSVPDGWSLERLGKLSHSIFIVCARLEFP